MKRYLLLFSIVICLSACDSVGASYDTVRQFVNDKLFTKETKNTIDDLTGQMGESASHLSSLTSDEVKKLLRIEYKVVLLPGDTAPDLLEATLQSLGTERWDCLSILPVDNNLRVICRRYPLTYLRALPYLLRLTL